ncbi:MAG: winged helix-turn-helix domain-containing protein [Pseudomonadota bacterium]
MIYLFDQYELDADKVELRAGGDAVAVEPQVFSLLLLLVENRERMVSKDEIIEKVWDGRIVSESAVTSRIKSARQALGDDGKTQKYIRTVHGQGFRFVGEATAIGGAARTEIVDAPAPDIAMPASSAGAAKPSIAVLPFRLIGIAGSYSAIADALPHELISELSRLRWLFVIARGSSFRFRGLDPDIANVGHALGVRYCLSGIVEVVGTRITVTVELADTRDGGVVWSERYEAAIDDIYEIRRQIVSSIISSLEIQIPLHEAQRARITPVENLDAWAAYHMGLQHLHRFNSQDNAAATAMFERAVALDPGFARAHAGLSSTYFQNAFLGYNDDRNADGLIARKHAERSVELDPLDPFANFVMGRVHWIENDIAGGVGWLDRAISISPNYAQGVYARSWADAITGHGAEGAKNADLALTLSPLDPFRYAMIGVRAFTYMLRGEDAEAAYWADEAARTPGAHVLIAMIAVAAHALNGDKEKAAAWAENVRRRNPGVTREDFFKSFPFDGQATRERFSKALGEHGF